MWKKLAYAYIVAVFLSISLSDGLSAVQSAVLLLFLGGPALAFLLARLNRPGLAFAALVVGIYGGLALSNIADFPNPPVEPGDSHRLREQLSGELAGCYDDAECGAWLGAVEAGERNREDDLACSRDATCSEFREWYEATFETRQ